MYRPLQKDIHLIVMGEEIIMGKSCSCQARESQLSLLFIRSVEKCHESKKYLFLLEIFCALEVFSINVKLKCVSVCGMNTIKYQQFVPSLSELLHRGLYICSVCITERQEEIMSKNKTAMTW